MQLSFAVDEYKFIAENLAVILCVYIQIQTYLIKCFFKCRVELIHKAYVFPCDDCNHYVVVEVPAYGKSQNARLSPRLECRYMIITCPFGEYCGKLFEPFPVEQTFFYGYYVVIFFIEEADDCLSA